MHQLAEDKPERKPRSCPCRSSPHVFQLHRLSLSRPGTGHLCPRWPRNSGEIKLIICIILYTVYQISLNIIYLICFLPSLRDTLVLHLRWMLEAAVHDGTDELRPWKSTQNSQTVSHFQRHRYRFIRIHHSDYPFPFVLPLGLSLVFYCYTVALEDVIQRRMVDHIVDI